MSVYGFDEGLNKVDTPQQSAFDALTGRVSTIETYNRGSSGKSTNEAKTYVSFTDSATFRKRGNLVAVAWTFDTKKAVPAYTTLATVPTAYKPMLRHYFVGSAGKKFMITTTGYIQNVDALETGKNHILGTSYMGVD